MKNMKKYSLNNKFTLGARYQTYPGISSWLYINDFYTIITVTIHRIK